MRPCLLDDDGKLTRLVPCQNAHLAKKTVGRRFSVSEKERPLVTPTGRGRFRGQTDFRRGTGLRDAGQGPGKPVKVVITREEDFSGWNSRTEQRQTIRMGVSKTAR